MGKFSDKEASRATISAHSAAKAMGSNGAATEKRLVSFQASADMYKKFTDINQRRGISNSAAINMFVSEYVAEHEDMLK